MEKQIVRLFRRNGGLSIQPDAMNYIMELVDSVDSNTVELTEVFIQRLCSQLLSRFRKCVLHAINL